MKSNFRLPGPTPLPPEVLAAMQREMIPHRGASFRDFYRDLLDRLGTIHRTEGDVLIWPASGSAGWEIGITNFLSPGDPVLSVVTGDFGERFARFARQFDLDVRRVEVPWGEAATPDVLEKGLRANPDVRAVLLTHNETSTGVTNPIAELAPMARRHGALVLVDAVSSLAGLPFEMDRWEVDFVLSGSQKAWMCPPGLAIVAVGPRGWAAVESSGYRRSFWDLMAARSAAEKGMTPATPALSLLYGLEAALSLIEGETLEGVWERHAALGRQTRSGLEALGLTLLAKEPYASNTVTAFLPPAGISVKEIVETMQRDHGVTLTGGQGPMSDSVVRIGHMGWVDQEDIAFCLEALGKTIAAREGRATS